MKTNVAIRASLAQALDVLLSAYLMAGGTTQALVAGEALDAAMAGDKRVLKARKRMMQALKGLRDADHNQSLGAYLAAEESVNLYVARSAEAGIRVGCLLRGQLPG